jgi:hypothetical protein
MKAYPLLPFDQHILGAEGFTDTEQRSKGGASALATVEAEDEFVEVGWQVFPAESVIDAQRPVLEVGEDPVHLGVRHMAAIAPR